MQEQVYFEVKMHGEYFAQDGKDRMLRGYEATFKVPDAQTAVATIVKKLLMPFLRKLDPQALSAYTYLVDEITCNGRALDPNEIPVRLQSRAQLADYIRLHKLPILISEYGSLGLLREHVRLAQEDPEGFVVISEKHKTEVAADKALFDLNQDVPKTMVAKKSVPLSKGGEGNSSTSPARRKKSKKKSSSIKAEEMLS